MSNLVVRGNVGSVRTFERKDGSGCFTRMTVCQNISAAEKRWVSATIEGTADLCKGDRIGMAMEVRGQRQEVNVQGEVVAIPLGRVVGTLLRYSRVIERDAAGKPIAHDNTLFALVAGPYAGPDSELTTDETGTAATVDASTGELLVAPKAKKARKPKTA